VKKENTQESLDITNNEHMAYKLEEQVEGEGEEMQLLSAHPTRKDTFTAMSVSMT
jgi:hypothetical protein